MILRHPILAADISNLTDARYFAAWQVPYMTFRMDEGRSLSPSQVKEIKDWVEGPLFFLSFYDNVGADYIAFMMQETGIQNIYLGEAIEEVHFPNHSPEKIITEINLDLEVQPTADVYAVVYKTDRSLEDQDAIMTTTLRALSQRQNIILDMELSVGEIDPFISRTGIHGLLVRGGEEEKVGYKSFDVLDELFEHLEIDQ